MPPMPRTAGGTGTRCCLSRLGTAARADRGRALRACPHVTSPNSETKSKWGHPLANPCQVQAFKKIPSQASQFYCDATRPLPLRSADRALILSAQVAIQSHQSPIRVKLAGRTRRVALAAYAAPENYQCRRVSKK